MPERMRIAIMDYANRLKSKTNVRDFSEGHKFRLADEMEYVAEAIRNDEPEKIPG